MTDSALITWSVLMPVKVLAQAKSRLAPLAGPRRGELALALAKDTLSVVLKCEAAARVVVITDDEAAAGALGALGALVVPDEPRDGLNAALRHGAAYAAPRWPGAGLAALSADLPALRPARAGPRPARRRRLAERVRGRCGRRWHDAVHRGAGRGVPARIRRRVTVTACGGRGC